VGYWEAAQSVHNRPSTKSHYLDIANDINRNGFQRHRGGFTIGTNGYARFLDAGHRGIALDYCGDFPKGTFVNVFITPTESGIAGIDEKTKSRSLADVIHARGIGNGWELTIQEVISSCILLASGQSLSASRKFLPHIKGDNGKALILGESEQVDLLFSDVPVFSDIIDTIKSIHEVEPIAITDDEGETESYHVYEFSGWKAWADSTWVLAVLELSAKYPIETLLGFIRLVATDSIGNPYVAKLNSWRPTKGDGGLKKEFHVLCAAMEGYCNGGELSRRPQSRSTSYIRTVYDAWNDVTNNAGK
jgi:hypothetical protein